MADLCHPEGKQHYYQQNDAVLNLRSLSGLRSILSGPAGGVVGYAETCYDRASATPVIGFDMVR
jgi:5-oxoprolinase (ATP-hydrolysing)